MGFEVPIKINQAVTTSNVRQVYGRENGNIVKMPISKENMPKNVVQQATAPQAQTATPKTTSYAQPSNAYSQPKTTQYAPPSNAYSQPKTSSYAQPSNAYSQPKATQYAQPNNISAPQVSAPQVRRKRAADCGNTIVKGQKWTVADRNGRVPGRLKIGVGWETTRSGCEVDASAFMLAKNEKVPDESCFIFYGQDTSADRSVFFRSNADNPASPDDAEIDIALGAVRQDVQKIIICLTIYESFKRKLNFSMVRNIYARIMDENGTEIARYKGEYLPETVTSLVIGELYRYNGSWKFYAVGSGFRKDLEEFCNIYGIEIR